MTAAPDPDARKRGIAGVFDRGAHVYDQVGVDFFTPAARDLVRRARLRAGERVLDLGTGRGAVLFAAAEAVGESGHAIGIDLAPRMADLTQAAATARGLGNVAVSVGDAEDPHFAAGSFDAILGSLVIFFLPNPAAALQRYAALLTPPGRLGITTFGKQDANFEAAMRALDGFVPGPTEPRSARQGPFRSREGIAELLTGNGFSAPVIDETTYESRFTDLDHWLEWVWSHGGRFTLERIPADRFDEAVDAARAELAAARTPAGDYAIHTEIRFTIARPS